MQTRTMLRDRLRQSRDWSTSIDELEKELEGSGTKPEQSERLFELAAIAEEVIPERDRALGLYQRAWKLHPDNLKALSRAREVYAEIGRLEMVGKLGEMELRSPAAAANLAAIVGEALLDSGQKDKALAVLQKALEKTPDSYRVKDALAALSYDPEFWTDEVERLTDEATRFDSAMAARMLLRAARIMRLQEPDNAGLEGLLRQVLGHDIDEPSANFMLESLLAAAQRWTDLEAHHDARVQHAADSATKIERCRGFGLQWLQRFKDRERSARFFTQAVNYATSNGAVAMRSSVAMFALLRQTSTERKDWAGLLAIADSLLQRNTAGSDADEMASEKLYVSSVAGAIGFEQLGDEGVARKYYRIAAGVAPKSPAVAEFVEAFGLGADEPVVAVAAAAVVVDAAAEKAAADQAAAAEKAAADQAAAAEKAAAEKAAAEKAAAADQGAAAQAAAAEQAAAEKAAAEQAAEAAATKAAAEQAAEAAAAKAAAEQAAEAAAAKAAAEQAAAKPAEAPRAARSTAAPKAEVPADLGAAMDAARSAEAGNDKGIGAWKDVIAKHSAQRGPRRELARILRGNQAWSQLADALRDEEAKATSSSTEKAELLRELAEVYGKLSNDNQVIAALTSSLGHDASQLDVYDQLASVYESKKRWPDLVKVLGEKAEQVNDVDGKVAIHLQIANLYLERFSNQAEAIKAFERVLELDPQNGTAIEHLLSVYEKRRDWEKLIKLKENEIAQTPEGERAAKVIEVAKMAATKVKKPEICTHWWEMVVQYEPTHEEALAELYKLYERNKEWDKLADISSKQADSASDDKARADALQRLGILYTEKLENSGKAIDAWQRLLAIDENHRRAQDALKKLYVTEGRWDDLEEFYRSRGKLDEYIRVLEREVEAGSEQHRLTLAMKIATLYRDELQKPDRAMRAFEKVLTLDENNLVAAEALIPLYESSRDPRRLVGVLEIQLKSTEDLNMRQERMKRLAEYNEEKLKEKGAAFQWWLKAHAEDHNAEWIRTEAERLAGETGAWNQLVDAYTASLPKFEHKSDALPLMLVMARVIEQEQGDVDRALDVNRQILAIDDSNEQAVDALERLYLGKGRYQELLDIYQKKLDLTSDGDVRVAIQSKIGQLYEDEVKDDKKAIAAYQAILDAAGDVPSALTSLDRVYLRNQMWPQLADILSRQLLVTGPDDDKALHLETKYRVGQIRETHLNDASGALDAYRDILDLDVNHDKARTALERRLATSTDDKHRLAVAGVLEPVYEQLGSWESLVGIHEIQLAAETDTLRKTSLLLRIGELQRANLGNAEKSFDAHARAFAIDPSTDVSKQQIEELAPHIDNGWQRVNALFEGAIVKPTIDPSLAHELCGKVATNYEQQLHDSGKAVEFFRKALAQEPEDLAALSALEKIFERDAQYKDLLEVYRRRVDISSEPAERLKFLFGIADLQEHRLSAPQEAISAYNEILGQEPDDLRALQALDRLYVGTKQWRDLGDNLSRQLLLVEADDERVTLLVRLAQLRETHLAEGGAAVETYRQVLDIDASNSDSIVALERMLSIPEHELTIANILEPIYHARGDWQKQIGVYEIMAKHSYDPARKIELLHKIAELHEVGGDDTGNAFATHARALREDPRNDTTHGQIERLARGLGQWSQAASLYDSIATETSDDDLKVALLTRRAQVQESELRDDKAAVASYERILQTAPQAVDAATAIQAIHERNSDWPALVAALRRKSEILVDISERKALLLRAAQIEEEVIGDNDAAIATYNQVLRIDENDGAAMDALERIYVRLSRWAPLKDIYAKKVELADDPADKKQMLYVLAQVYDRELGDVAKAIETYQGILDIDADELPAIQSLDRLYGQAERWYDLLGNLERQVELADSSGEHVALKYRIGHLWQTRLGDLARAVESYREALELDPAHAETLRALDGLLRGKNEPVMAAKVLEPIYDATGEYAKLIEVLEVMVTHAEDPLTRVELLHRIALLNEQRLGAAEPAFDAYARALKDDAGNNLTLGHIERLAELTNRWPTLAKLYAAEADKSLDVPRQVDLLARLARISEQEVNDVPAAIGTYRRILDVEFDNKPAVLALDRLYTQTQAWPELTEILRREIQLADDDAEVATLQYRLGATLEHRQGDRKAAVEVYREIISANPTHGETIAALEQMFHAGHHQGPVGAILEPLYETANENEKLHGLFQVQLGALQGTERQSMYQRLAELAEHRLYDASRASAWWGQAYVEDPRWEAAGEHIERLAKDTGGWDDLVAVYTQALARNAEPELQRQILLRMARVYEYEQRDVAKAVETHLRVLEVAPTDADALASLDRLYLGAGMYDDLVEILRRRVEITTDHDEHLELLFRRGAVFAEALGDSQAALECYNAILEKESRNRRALECVETLQFHRQEWAALRDTYEKLVDVADGDDELAGIYSRMAHLDSEALGNDDRSVELWGRVLDIRAEDQTALSALGGIHTRREQWEALIEIIERQVAVAPSEREQVALYKQMGQVWADKLGRERNAIDAWTAADRVNPNDLETLRALAHLYRSTQSWDELSQTLRRILELGAVTGQVSEEESIELYAQLGQLEGDILGRVDDAVRAWRQVVALDPADFRALAALETLFTREGRWEEAIEVMEKRALVLDDEGQRRDTLLQAAATWEEKVENPVNAALVYERVRQNEPANVVASDRLEAIYRESHRWQELVEVLLERADLRTDTQEQIRTLNEVAHIYETELNDQESAFVVLQAAFKRDYANEQTAVQLERLATATNRWQELLDEYTNRVNELEREDRSAAADLWVKIGRWYGEHLSHLEWAIHSVQQALRIDPSHTGALTALAELQRKRGSWHELIETLQKHAALEPAPQKKAGLYTQLAELLEMQVQDVPGAVNAYQQALVYDAKARSNDVADDSKKPGAKAALVALDRLYRRTEQWEPLIDVLGKRAEQETEERESLRYRLEVGQIWDLRIYDSGRAISAYQGVLDIDPGNQQALRALESLYEKTNQSEKYLEVLEAQLDTSPSDAERVALYERMAAAWEERFGKLDRAAECLEKIVAIDGRNFAAYRELARLYAQAGKSEALVETYRNHIMATTDTTTRVDLYCAMGAVYETQLNDLDRSIESYTDVLTFSSEEPRALDALGRLYEKISEWDRAIESMAQLVRITDEPRKQVDLFWRMGRIQYNQLHDAEASEANFLRGLTIDPGHVATMEALVKQYSDRGDWLKAAQMMVRAESYTPVITDKVRLLNEAGHIYQEKLHAPEQAKQLYAAVISLDPEHVDAGRPLAELYFANQEWRALSPVIDMLVRKVAQLHPDPRELNELYYRAAKTADEVGEAPKALNYYKAAYDIDSTHLPTLTGRADLLFKMQDWDNAGKIYQTILVQHRDNQSEGDVVRIYNRLGMVRQALGERKKALNMFEKALEIDPNHRETLLAVIDLQQAANDWEAVVHAKRSLIATSPNKDKVALLDEVGAIYRDKLANPQKATAAYVEALEFTPDDHQLLQKLLDLYTETKQWRKVVETIERFVTLEADPIRKAAYHQAAATICRDELKSLDEAVDYYNLALDAFFSSERLTDAQVPRALKAFESIDRILTSKKDWKAQERAYRDMVKRLPQNDNPVLHKVRVGLLDGLGEIYRSRLKNFQTATEVFQFAQQLDPKNELRADGTDRAEILAELYLVAGPDYADKAVEQHMRMLRNEPFKYDSYKALRRIYMDAHQYDKTWCLCNTLAFLKKADEEELRFYEQYKPRGFTRAKASLTPDGWAKLVHPDENRYISSIFATVWQSVAMMKSYPHKDAGIKRKDKLALPGELMFSKLFYYAAQVLNVQPPEVFLVADNKPADIQLGNFSEKDQLIPSFVVRPHLLQGKSEREVAFLSARRLTYLRPEYYLKLLLPTNTELKIAMLSAIALVNPRFPLPPDSVQLVQQYMPEMQKRIPPHVLEQLAVVVNRFIQAAPEINLAAWGHAVDAVSHRTGFLICGDLEVAARMVSAEPVIVGGPQVKDKIKELVLYSISEEYFAVRAMMSLTIAG